MLLSAYPDVKLSDHGSRRIEVLDNGKGVQEDNFQGLSELLMVYQSGL